MKPVENEERLSILAGDDVLEGCLITPPVTRGLILFAHGSGSSRFSPRNQYVAKMLHERGFGTLLFDLLTADEELQDSVNFHLRFDIPFLARRLGAATDWVQWRGLAGSHALAYFGASTGSAAALVAAAQRPETIRAVVSRGGRPDLVGPLLPRVTAPTLLIVGGADLEVLDANRQALEDLGGPKELAVVPGAGHLFHEPGALDVVGRLAGDWFERCLTPASADSSI